MSTNSANELSYVDVSGSWSCPARAGMTIKITQTGAAGRGVLEESGSELFTFDVKERVATITSIGNEYGVTGVVSQDGKMIIWSNGYAYTRASPAKVTYGGAKVTVKSWKGDYLHRPDSAKGVTTWGTGVGNEWTIEQLDSGKITLKSWKGDYLHRPDSAKDVTTWHTGIGNEWTIETIERTQKLINVKSITRADDVPHLWGAVDTAGIAGVPIAFLELTWVDQGITTLSIPAKVRITRPLSIGTTGPCLNGIHHLHINNLEVYDQAGAKLTLVYNGNASQDVARGHDINGVSCTPALAIDGDGTTGNISTMQHNAWLPNETTNAYGTEDHWMEFDVSEGHPSSIFIRNNHVSERLAGSTLAVLDSKGSSMEEFTLTAEKLQQYDLTDTSGTGHRKGLIHARKVGGAWVKISTDFAEHELTRESFEIPAALLGGKIELGYSVGSGGGHKLFITDAEVEITQRKYLITVDVGSHSGPCPKVVTLPSAGLQVSSTPVNPQQQLVQGSGANATTYYADNWTDIDKFRVEVEGNLLKVFRVDAPNHGWGQHLVLGAM